MIKNNSYFSSGWAVIFGSIGASSRGDDTFVQEELFVPKFNPNINKNKNNNKGFSSLEDSEGGISKLGNLRFWTKGLENSGSSTSARFYIYPWSDDIIDRWPINYTHKRLAVAAEFKDNFGAGRLEDSILGMYHTHQYALFRIFYYRLLEHPSRTLDPSEASLFFIPFDLGMDSSARRSDGAMCRTDCPTMPKVYQLLQQSPYFQARQGRDHFIIHSINQPMLHFTHEACVELYKLCINCTKLSIDAYDPSLFNVLNELPHLHKKWISVPFPSNFHWSPTAIRAPWLQLQQQSAALTEIRPYKICFMGSDQVTARLQRALRVALRDQCKSRPTDCLLIDLKTHDSQTNVFHDFKLEDKAFIQARAQNPYLHSTFCLMPGGDFPTRKGFFDSLLSGCIPVTFQLSAAIHQ